MQKYFNYFLDERGEPIRSASVHVKTSAGATATIYTSAGAATTNPFSTNTTGYFEFYVPNGLYTVVLSKSGHTTVTIDSILIDDPTVATIAALKAAGLPTTANARITVLGYTSAGDGGGGDFYWVTGDQSANVTADPSSGIWVAPDSDPTGASGAWKGLRASEINPKWFGAVADGSTHPLSGYFASLAAAQAVYPHAVALTDEIDWAALQAANNYLIDNYGSGRISCPQGTYLLSRTLTLGGIGGFAYTSYVDLAGSDGVTSRPDAVVFKPQGFTGSLITISGGSVRGISFESSDKTTAGHRAIEISDSKTLISIERNYFVGFYDHVYVNTRCDSLFVRGNYFRSKGHHGFSMLDCTGFSGNVEVSNNWFLGTEDTATDTVGAYLRGVRGGVYQNNQNVGQGGYNTYVKECTGLKISGYYSEDHNSPQMYSHATQGVGLCVYLSNGVEIDSFWIDGGSDGFQFDSSIFSMSNGRILGTFVDKAIDNVGTANQSYGTFQSLHITGAVDLQGSTSGVQFVGSYKGIRGTPTGDMATTLAEEVFYTHTTGTTNGTFIKHQNRGDETTGAMFRAYRFNVDVNNPAWALDVDKGSASGTGRLYFGIGGTNYLRIRTNEVSVESAAWNGTLFKLASYSLWVDADGKILNKSTAPTGDTDGTSVGLGTTQTTVGAAGGASALPATPTGYAKIRIGGTEYVIPYYAVA